eukprot:6390241-Pyramimonas_sp.AAC.1
MCARARRPRRVWAHPGRAGVHLGLRLALGPARRGPVPWAQDACHSSTLAPPTAGRVSIGH